MEFTILREKILKPLQLVSGAAERRQTLPILSNVLLSANHGKLSITATDLEIEMTGRAEIENMVAAGETTVSARKLIDICRTLPEGSLIEFKTEKDWVAVRSKKSRLTLATLSAKDYPSIEAEDFVAQAEVAIPQNKLKKVLENTHFAMAQQDVRHFLNGMLFCFGKKESRVAATNGHRVAVAELSGIRLVDIPEDLELILPRKGTIELMKLLEDTEDEVKVTMGANHFRADTADFTLISKLIEGKFADYGQMIPKNTDKTVVANRDDLKQTLIRASVLSNEMFKGVRLVISDGLLKVFANNQELEQGEEELVIQYKGPDLEIGFNVTYLIDVLSIIKSEEVKMSFTDAEEGVLIEDINKNEYLYIVMPMLL